MCDLNERLRVPAGAPERGERQTVRVSCVACGAVVEVEIGRGTAKDLTLKHEASCGYLAAMEAGHPAVAHAWLAVNGYPIRFENVQVDSPEAPRRLAPRDLDPEGEAVPVVS